MTVGPILRPRMIAKGGEQMIRRRVARVATVVAVLVACAVVGFLGIAPRVLGGATLTVLSGSMSPTIPTGSVVLIKPVEDVLTIEPGTVITFQKSPTERALVTHRVVDFQPETTPPSYITKGDANRGEDIDPVPIGAIRGEVVTHVPYLGSLADLFGGPRGRYLVGFAIGAFVIITQSRRLIRALREPDEEDGATNGAGSLPAPTTASTR